MFFLKNYTQNGMENLVPDPFIKNRNWAYICIKQSVMLLKLDSHLPKYFVLFDSMRAL